MIHRIGERRHRLALDESDVDRPVRRDDDAGIVDVGIVARELHAVDGPSALLRDGQTALGASVDEGGSLQRQRHVSGRQVCRLRGLRGVGLLCRGLLRGGRVLLRALVRALGKLQRVPFKHLRGLLQRADIGIGVLLPLERRCRLAVGVARLLELTGGFELLRLLQQHRAGLRRRLLYRRSGQGWQDGSPGERQRKRHGQETGAHVESFNGTPP